MYLSEPAAFLCTHPAAVFTQTVHMQVQRKLIIALILALCFMVVEVVGGVLANR